MFHFRLLLLFVVFVLFAGAGAAPWTVNGKLKNGYELNGNLNGNDIYRENNNDYPRVNEALSDEYHSYMEKKVAKIVERGAVYLEGLRRALQNYTSRLESCTDKYKHVNYTDPVQLAGLTACQKATAESERVRRVTQLALWTTRQIQERGYVDQHREDEIEDKMLLLRLSWLLDRLAHMTGYEPKAEDYLTTVSSAKTTSQLVTSFPMSVNVSDEVKMSMIHCLDKDANSSQPAYVRCLTQAPMTPPPPPSPSRALSNLTDITTNGSTEADTKTSSSDANETQDLIPSSSLLIKTSTTPNTDKTPKTERHTRWRRENTRSQNGGDRNSREDGVISISRIPEDPAQDISGYVKSKEGTNTNAKLSEVAMLRASLERTFQNPNQEITRRYGANYNPLVPNTVLAGIAAGLADI